MRPLIVKMDPRVKTSPEDLEEQFDRAPQLKGEWSDVAKVSREAEHLRLQLKSLRAQVTPGSDLAAAIEDPSRKVEAAAGAPPAQDFGSFPAPRPAPDKTSLRFLTGALGTLESVIESADTAPTPDAVTAFYRIQPVLRSTLSACN